MQPTVLRRPSEVSGQKGIFAINLRFHMAVAHQKHLTSFFEEFFEVIFESVPENSLDGYGYAK